MKIKPIKTIPSAGPDITEAEIKLVNQAIRSGWYERRNLHLDLLTAAIQRHTDKRYCLPTSSGTAAIHLALLGLNIGPGDEVIVPDITWTASAAPIHYVGATPVFCDIDERSWCLSPASFEERITKKTKAVIVVNLYGNMVDIEPIRSIARRRGIAIIEDAAESIGGEYRGRPAGTLGDVGIFSFNATKLVIAGQGGMLVTDNKKVYERAKKLAHHGMRKYTIEATFWSEEIGFNYQWTNLQAALALAQFRRLRELLAKKKRAFGWYRAALEGIPGIQLNDQPRNATNTYWIVSAIIDSAYGWKKEQLMKKFRSCHIDLRPFFYPLSSMPAWKPYVRSKNMRQQNPVAYRISPYGICLPSATGITKAEVDYVCDCLKKTLRVKPTLCSVVKLQMG